MMRLFFVILIFELISIFFNGSAFSQNKDNDSIDLDLDFKIEEFEKKPYSLNGDIKIKETLRFLDRESLLFKQKYLDNYTETTSWQTDLDLTIEGQYQKDIIKLYGRFKGLFYYNDDENFNSEGKAEEAYISLQPSIAWAFDAGKKVHKWGKGYAFNPLARSVNTSGIITMRQ